jgi:hypothetical protein
MADNYLLNSLGNGHQYGSLSKGAEPHVEHGKFVIIQIRTEVLALKALRMESLNSGRHICGMSCFFAGNFQTDNDNIKAESLVSTECIPTYKRDSPNAGINAVYIVSTA